MSRQLLSLSLVALSLASSAETEAQAAADSVCPTCASSTAGTGAAGGGSASVARCYEQATPLTSEIAVAFGLETLRAYLERPNVVAGHFGADGTTETARPAEESAAVELEFDVGEFTYYEKIADAEIRCDDTVHAPARIAVRIGDGLLSFEADGVLWKGKNEPSAHFYASYDLAAAVGSYRPSLDLTRVHIGVIEISLDAAPGHLRGNITPAVVYFRDEAQLQRYRQGAWWDFAQRPVLFKLGFPADACGKHALPFAHNEPIERLGRQSAEHWRARAVGLIAATTRVDAVWKDGRETQVALEVGEPVAGTACLSTSTSVGHHMAPASELALRIPLAGRLRSTDARLDMPLDELIVGIDGQVVVRATLRSWVPITRLSEAPRRAARGANADLLSARVSYDFEREPAALDGIVELLEQTTPGSYRRVGCVAFPRGGKADVSDCQYVYVPPSLR